MTNRENVLRALRRDNPTHVPFDFSLCPLLQKEFEERTGVVDYMEYYHFPFRYIKLNPTKLNTDYTVYYKNLPDNVQPLSWNPEWGVMSIPCDTEHFEHMLYPMKDFETVQEVMDYPMPDLTADYRWEGVDKQVESLIKQDLIAVASMQMTIFEISWYLRDIQNFLADMVLNEELAVAILDRVTEIRVEMAKRYAKADVDILMLGDDVSTQEAMMMSVPMWQKFIKPRLKKVIDSAKKIKEDVLIFYHGDGNLRDIIPDLIEVGVDVLNPVQPECFDPVEVKREFGDRLSFWGTIGTQTTMPFGSPEEVRRVCKEMIEKVGKGGGLLLAPTHLLEPEVPFENIMAFLEAVEEYGKY